MKKIATLILSCALICSSLLLPASSFAQTSVTDAVGTIEVPAGTDVYQNASAQEIGIIFFVTVMIRVFTIAVGVYAAFNFALAAYHFFNFSGDSGAMEKARNQFMQTIIGLFIIAMSYTLTGLVGLIFFGDPAFILTPTL